MTDEGHYTQSALNTNTHLSICTLLVNNGENITLQRGREAEIRRKGSERATSEGRKKINCITPGTKERIYFFRAQFKR